MAALSPDEARIASTEGGDHLILTGIDAGVAALGESRIDEYVVSENSPAGLPAIDAAFDPTVLHAAIRPYPATSLALIDIDDDDISVRVGKQTHKFPLLSTKNLRPIPTKLPESWVDGTGQKAVLEGAELSSIIRSSSRISEEMTIGVEPSSVGDYRLFARSQSPSERFEFVLGGVGDAEDAAIYSTSYLKPLLPIISSCEEVSIRWTRREPLFIHCEPEAGLELRAVIAPRMSLD